MTSPSAFSRSQFSSLLPYLTPPVAASLSIVPVFYGFVVKSAQQLGKPLPRMRASEILKAGFKAAPTIGITIGTQMVVQGIVENLLMKKSDGQKNEGKELRSMIVSSMIVGGVSAPPLAVFNGQTMGRTVIQSLRALSIKQTGAIMTRETSFLFSLRVSGPVSSWMKRNFKESRSVEYGSAFLTAAIGSLIGHPADTALTLWQKEMKLKTIRQSLQGAPVRALAVGAFAILYKSAKEGAEKRCF
ncbi:MAG: hypothetical protein A2Y28_01765 [Chlamydiae bacterium GWC2_50_10]|nr:MAG: hypothetical protein A2Y28_01765 [Chlamydiae bacterium GWC2_50_10]OGN58128.1 MAG: hypothetical protein A3D18_05780 [Chlamydiae bacterium RIFCSPHIGHO2_02_FULL_49_29]OGN75453.1 MAG: hypothetical protein A3G30_02305 [Chlamydiae bacterium RIFCSPLOWO2_12_FULL_49_12]